MEIQLNGKVTEIETEGIATFKDLMEYIRGEHARPPSVIIRIVLNEEELDEGQEIGLGGFSISEIASLEILTADRLELAYEALSDAQLYLPELATVLEHAAGIIRGGDVNHGLQVASEALEYISNFGLILDGIRGNFQIDLSKVQIDDITLLDKLLLLNQHSSSILAAVQSEDWTLFADLIEYELSPLLYEWMAVIPELVNLLPENPD